MEKQLQVWTLLSVTRNVCVWHKVLVVRLGNSVVRLTDRQDMTIAVDLDVKKQTKPNVLISDLVVRKHVFGVSYRA